MAIGRSMRIMGLALLLAVLAGGPFFRGLFFSTELLGALAAVFLGFALWAVGRRLEGLPVSLPGGMPGAALLILFGLYLLQFAWASFPRGNLDWLLRVGGAWAAFVTLRAEAGPRMRRWFGWLFVLSAAGLAVLGFLEYTGWLFRDPELVKTLSLVGLSERMFTTLQYPNTAAVYFLAALLAAAGLGLEELRAWKLTLAGGLMALLAMAFFFTISRGAIVVLPFGLLLFVLGLDRQRLWPALLLLLSATVAVVLTMRGVGAASAARHAAGAFTWIGIGVGAGALAGLGVAFLIRLKPRVQGSLALAALLAVVGGLALFRPTLPNQATRLLDINFRTVNVAIRLIYDQDAIQMAKDRPLGRGGFGWDRGYRQYQTFNYTARDTHNHFAQTAVEAGWLGLGALAAAIVGALWLAWKNRRENPAGWALAAAALLIAGHSLIDFNLSFGAVWLMMWSLLATAGPQPPGPALARFERPTTWTAAGLSLGAAALAALLCVGSIWSGRAEALTNAGAPDLATVAARRAAAFDPLNSEPLLRIGDLPALKRAAQLDPYHSGIRFQLAVALELNRDFEGALIQARAALANQPMIADYYGKVASLEGRLMIDDLASGRMDQAQGRATRLTQLGAEFGARKAVADPIQSRWQSAPLMEMGDEFKLRYGQALFLSNQKEKAEPLLIQAGKVGMLGSEAHVWLYALYEQRGDKQGMAQLEAKPWIRFRDQNPVYKAIRSR